MIDDEMSEGHVVRRRNTVSTVVSVVVGLGLLALVIYAFLSSRGGRPQPGDPAPSFSLALLDGSEVSLNDLRGQVVVLNFWASWCLPCRQEAPELQRAWEMYEDRGVIFLGVTFKDAEDVSRDFIQEFGLTYPNGIDLKGRISRSYGVIAVPETFIIDGDGKIAWFHIGEVSADALAEQLVQLLKRAQRIGRDDGWL